MKNENQKFHFEQLQDKRHIKHLEYQLKNNQKEESFRHSRPNYIALLISILALVISGYSYKALSQQNKLLSHQSVLLDAEKKGDLILLLTNLQDQIYREVSNSSTNSLSSNTKSRIISLSHSFKPYFTYEMDGDFKNKRLQSPERGLLFNYLAYSDINAQDLREIYTQGNFKYSDLSGPEFKLQMQLLLVN